MAVENAANPAQPNNAAFPPAAKKYEDFFQHEVHEKPQRSLL